MAQKQKPRDDFRIEPLTKAHDRAAFSCGNEALDNYLKKQAGQDVAKRTAVCFVLTPDSKTVAGFYTLSQYSVDLVKLPKEIVGAFQKRETGDRSLLCNWRVSHIPIQENVPSLPGSGPPPGRVFFDPGDQPRIP